MSARRSLLVSPLMAGLFLLAALGAGAQVGRSVAAQTSSAVLLQALTAEECEWLRDHPVIRVAQATDWPPAEFTDARGEPSGISEDYLRLIEQRLGIWFERVRGLRWLETYPAP